MQAKVRTRFAPSPTGELQLGNIRNALIVFLFAQKYSGTTILRIEDTDLARSSDDLLEKLFSDLAWLGLILNEAPYNPGECGPYLQSQRTEKYEKALNFLIDKKRVYRCFCSKDRLENLRKEQAAQKIPPGYDGLCKSLPEAEENVFMQTHTPFVWRYAIPKDFIAEIKDLSRGNISFDLKNFSDFAICRADGSFGFIFTNFVDDCDMGITHIIRGEDHVSNGALQLALYRDFEKTPPCFIHLQMILDKNGQKLSKRSGNFSLTELRNMGCLPEAILSYLAGIGTNIGFNDLSISDLAEVFDPTSLSAQGVRYDLKTLLETNKRWMHKKSSEELLGYALKINLVSPQDLGNNCFKKALELLKPESLTIVDWIKSAEFAIKEPELSTETLENLNEFVHEEAFNMALDKLLFMESDDWSGPNFSELANKYGFSPRLLFVFIRVACTGKGKGLSLDDIMSIISVSEVKRRVLLLIKALGLAFTL